MRSKVETLKVIYWYESINWLGDFKTSYAMEQYFEPLDNLTAGTLFRNKWRKYKDGAHTPSKRTIDIVNQKNGIPKKILDHYFWSLLDSNQFENIEYMVSKLDPYIIQLVYDCSPLGKHKLKALYKIDVKKLFLTIKSMPLDCLAVLYIYWRRNYEAERPCNRFAQECARYLYYALLVMGGMGHYCTSNRIMQLLYEWYSEEVMLKTSWGEYFPAMSSKIFLQNIFLLRNLVTINLSPISKNSKKFLHHYSQYAYDILFSGSLNAESKYLSRKIRWGKWNLEGISPELIQDVYYPLNYQRGLDILLMDAQGNYKNETYAPWLTLQLTTCGRLASFLAIGNVTLES